MNEMPNYSHLFLPLVYIMAGFIGGLALEVIVHSIFQRSSAGKTWERTREDVWTLRGVLVLWTTLGGIYAAIQYISIGPALLDLIHKLMLIAVILSVAFLVAQVAVVFIRFYARGADGAAHSTTILVNLTRLIIFLVAALVVLDSLGISILPALTALGVAGLAAALALQSTLANLFAGLQLLASNQIRLGDTVRLDTGEEGCVTDITWRTTTLRTAQNNITFVPNAKMAAATITNFARPEEAVNVFVQVGVGPASDLTAVERTTMDVARRVMKEVPGGVPDFEPALHYNAITEAGINFTAVLQAKGFADQYPIRDEFIKALTARLQKDGVLRSVSAG